MARSKNFTVRLPEDFIEELESLSEKHGITKATVIKVGLLRLLKKKPTAQELADAEAPIGNPEWKDGDGASKAGKIGGKLGGRGRKRS